MSNVHQAGKRLEELRLALQWTQQEASKRSRVPLPNISRLENGDTARPSMQDVVAYGSALGLTPNQLAELYGYWTDPKGASAIEAEDPDVTRLVRILKRLPEKQKQRVLGALEFLILEQRAESAGRVPDENQSA